VSEGADVAAVAENDTKKTTLLEDIKALGDSPRELLIIYLAKFLESVSYFSMIVMVTLWLSQDFGFSDVRAGWWAGTFSLVVTVLTFFVGFVADSIGFRGTLTIAFATSMIARAVMSYAKTPSLALIGLMALTFGTAAGVPVMNTAIRRYTTPRNRTFGFSLYYIVMNVGAMASGFLVDWARGKFKNPAGKGLIPKEIDIPILGPKTMTANGLIFFVGFVAGILAFVVSLMLRKGIDLDAKPQEESAKKEPEKRENPLKIAWSVMSEKTFWRFMLFIGLLVFVKLIFQHFHFTWPKYVTREMGEDFPIGKFYSINPILILILVPLATLFTRRKSAYTTIIVGSLITAASPFILCFGANYTTILAMIVVLSVGEALWSPRLYEYTATIAPRGREASYMGMSALPMFFAKMGVGPLSGYLLTQYCPEQGERHSGVMWGIIGVTTVFGPLLIIALRSVIEGKREKKPAIASPKDEPEVAAA
jgi:MFS family permease